MNLIEWTSAFIGYLDSFKREIAEKMVKDEIIVCKLKNGIIVNYIIKENLDKEVFDKIEGKSVISTLNSKSNLMFLIDNWVKFASYKGLKIIFANPRLNIQWSIIPHLHDKFTDSAGLKTGLKSLFSSVAEV